jgi:hypothetical protein
MCLFPPSLLRSVLNFQALQALPVCLLSFFPHGTLHEQPWHAPGCPSGGARVVPSRLVALMICLTCVVDIFC